MSLAWTKRLTFLAAAALAVTALATTALADASLTPSARKVASARTAALPRLVFFMNPNGAPCQMQDRILKEMGAELAGKAEVVYYKTTVPADLAAFTQYGIRALPTLVVTDASGKELRRATPGIQSAAQVRQLVQN
jgi:thioredoxin 1